MHLKRILIFLAIPLLISGCSIPNLKKVKEENTFEEPGDTIKEETYVYITTSEGVDIYKVKLSSYEGVLNTTTEELVNNYDVQTDDGLVGTSNPTQLVKVDEDTIICFMEYSTDVSGALNDNSYVGETGTLTYMQDEGSRHAYCYINTDTPALALVFSNKDLMDDAKFFCDYVNSTIRKTVTESTESMYPVESESTETDIVGSVTTQESTEAIDDSTEVPHVDAGDGIMKSFGLAGADTKIYANTIIRDTDERFDAESLYDEKFTDVLVCGKVRISRGQLSIEYSPENKRGYLSFPKSATYNMENLDVDMDELNWKYTKFSDKITMNGIYGFGIDLPKGKFKVISGTCNVLSNPPRVSFDENNIEVLPGEVTKTYTAGQEIDASEGLWISAKDLKLEE